jgi:uronate dehydrogenase
LRIVITGASGSIGMQVADDLSDTHELCLIDRRAVPGRASITADLAHYYNHAKSTWVSTGLFVGRRWWKAFLGAEIVIHLAEEPQVEASWQQVCDNNLRATWNILQAAIEYRVRRVIYASSGWVVKSHELQLAPECYKPNGPKIDSAAFPRPKSPYGLAKAFGEMTGRSLVDEGKLGSFVALRIGWFDPNPPKNKDYQRLGIGVRDLRSLFRRCVEADFRGFHVVYGVSAQKNAPFDLSYTRQLLSWDPVQLPE